MVHKFNTAWKWGLVRQIEKQDQDNSAPREMTIFLALLLRGACMGQKISAKQLKTDEGGGSSCANALVFA